MSLRRRLLPLAAVAVAGTFALLSVSCGGGGSPSTSTPVTTVSPQPTPTPGGGAGSTSCPLGNGTVGAECSKGSSRLLDAVFAAMDTLVQTKPQIFDKTQEAGTGTGQYLVVDKEAYLNGLVANLTATGCCAQRDPDDFNYERIQVKNENGFSETFDVITGTGYVRRNGTYYETCTPSSFPVDRGDAPPAGSGCGQPYPPPISKMNCKKYIRAEDVWTLDSTAVVGPASYCAEIGYTDGRALCPVRKEDSPERGPCEEWRVGYAKDTGRTGPTWTFNGNYCTGRASGCENHPTNQFELLVYVPGTFKVCAQAGDCCNVTVD